MIEFCSKKRMLAGVICLGGLTLVVLIFESQWTSEAKYYNHLTNYSLLEKNASASEFCWLKEAFSVVKECHQCTDFEVASKSKKACVPNKYKEIVKCLKSGIEVERSCTRVVWLEEKRFWQFEIFSIILAVTSSCCVFLRQKILDQRYLRSLQRRMANSV